MRIAIGIIAVLLVLAIIYYFLPQGIKTTVSAVFTGNKTSQTKTNASASPSAVPVAASPNSTATSIALASPSPSGLLVARGSATPAASFRPAAQTSGTPSATARTVASSNLPGTGFQNQPVELTIIQILASTLLTMVGIKLRKHI